MSGARARVRVSPQVGQVWERRNGTRFEIGEVRGGWVRTWPERLAGERRRCSRIAVAGFHRHGFRLYRSGAWGGR